MHRARPPAAALGATLILAMTFAGGSLAADAEAADHPLVGSWAVGTPDDEAEVASDLYVVHADGTITNLAPVATSGVGSWRPAGPQSADVSMLYAQVDEDGVLSGHRLVRGHLEVAEDGSTFSGTMTVELTGGEEGTSGQLGPRSISGTRISVEPMAEAATSQETEAEPLRPAPDRTTDCAGQAVLIDQSLRDFYLSGDCPLVIVRGSSIDVEAGDIGSVEVEGRGNDVDAAIVGSATITGNLNDLEARQIGTLVILGNSNDVDVRGPIDEVFVDGSRNDVEGRPIGSVVSHGRFNDIGRR